MLQSGPGISKTVRHRDVLYHPYITLFRSKAGQAREFKNIINSPKFSYAEDPQALNPPVVCRMVGALQSGLDQVKARAMKVRRALRDNEPLEGAMCVTDSEGHVECDGLDESHECM